MSYDHCSTNSGASCPLRYHSDWLSCGHMAHIWFIGVLLILNFICGFWEREILFFLGYCWSGLLKPGADWAMSPALGIKLLHFRKEWVQPRKRGRGLGDGMRKEEGRREREGQWEWDTIIWFPEHSSGGGHLRYEPVNSDFFLSQSGFSFCSLKSRIPINLLVYLKQWLPYKWEVIFLSQQNPDSKSKLLIRNRVIYWIPAKG